MMWISNLLRLSNSEQSINRVKYFINFFASICFVSEVTLGTCCGWRCSGWISMSKQIFSFEASSITRPSFFGLLALFPRLFFISNFFISDLVISCNCVHVSSFLSPLVFWVESPLHLSTQWSYDSCSLVYLPY